MKDILIIYDSVFGNTAKIAQSMAYALEVHHEVDIRLVGEVFPEHLDGVKTLIVGSPTRQFKATGALDQFLKQVPAGTLEGIQVAAFDTRMTPEDVSKNKFLALMVMFFGYAAEKIAKQLILLGGKEVVSPQGFLVTGIEGPLVEGELARAADWVLKIINNA
ncbi:MAG: nitric oxide synthase [Chloroflexi bacterium HGW-Chloroflexi-3]|nr:MAG: nitric oxide synthase [Chloroflexi bacterium HGW-Chloroflexi-3]